MFQSNTNIFQTFISLKARIKAEEFCCHQTSLHKQKQVYFNTLAVSAVSSYLNCIGWTTSLETSDSWNPIMQTMMDVADLDIPNYGKLECRAILPHQSSVTIPPEVWSQRIAYVVVELDFSRIQATLLGFVPQIAEDKLPLTRLQPLNQLSAYLCQQKRSNIVDINCLSDWLNGVFSADWQQSQEVYPLSKTINFRCSQKIVSQLASGVSRIKVLHLDDSEQNSITLMLDVSPQESGEYDISVKVGSVDSDRYLPQGLEIAITDRDRKPIMFAQAFDTETIEFCFSGELGEYFSIELTLDDNTKIETFII